MARSAVCSDVLARSARHDMPLARSALTLRALTAQPLTSAVRPRRKPHRVLVMPCDHQPTWLDHSASTINVVEVPRLLLPVSVDLRPTVSYEMRCGTHRCGVSSTDGYDCIHTIPYDGCDSHTVIFPPSERARISFVEISRIAPQFAVRRSRHEMQPNAIHI